MESSYKKRPFISITFFHFLIVNGRRLPNTGFLSSPSSQSDDGGLGYQFLIQAANLTTCPGSCIRPVGLAFGKDGRLYVSSDSSGEVSFPLCVSSLFCNILGVSHGFQLDSNMNTTVTLLFLIYSNLRRSILILLSNS